MSENVLFFIVFLGQVFLLSYYLPRQLLKSRQYVFENFPRDEYPKLYPSPMSYYLAQQKQYKLWNYLILFAGIILAVYMFSSPGIGEWDGARTTWFFLLQLLPVLKMELATFKEFKLMRNHVTSSLRKAELQPRNLFDYISPAAIAAAVFTYVAFVIFIIYMNQFGYPWFGGYWNIVGVTGANLFYAGIIYWYMRGKKSNPHISAQDRARQTSTMAKVMVLVSIAATVSVTLNILLAAAELRVYQPIAHTLYYQVLALVCFQFYKHVYYMDFDVYKSEPVAT